ncbi:Dabb family protein [Rhizobium rhizogenes]|uniref:Dabb family protein n=1 Tax=Rhizobium rhizogenes TaxID=359 RepID=A0AA88EVC5_RHIRH|nr:Dabb family protein [Rhizobium rhizogenes]KAA3498012.1 Dabb family protein [Rhizobium rhizogenes]KAA3521823.1 Dabb family protein [Agrobacterium tumefaciens]
MIRHTVAFRLTHLAGSDGERRFLNDAEVLATIPGVRNFQQLRQISAKNKFHFLFSMEFTDQAAYDNYNEHPVHTAFVRDRWHVEVAEFLEGDYIDL